MADTRTLIERLARDARPVRPIASPLRRTVLWLVLAVVIAALVIAHYGLRANLGDVMHSGPDLVEWIASLLTGVCAAYAAFQVSVPGRSKAWAWLPVPPLLLWLTGLGWGCLRDYAHMGAAAFVMEAATSECAIAIAFTSVPLGLALLWMVRFAGVVRPMQSALLAALGAAALSAASVTLYHEGENMLMVLLWHFGAVLVLSLACLALGRPLFAWIGPVKR
ncbi:hypothetical protein LYSHEL_28360 [Lysobacter helvus]|uniref:DUF1109 domain-containing protein n=2 Tax=Lysobacteraceae TaxID=32033 RepID=A0ABN6FXZ8_9GAMM|nr:MULTISPECIES: DUF1109 domain-containing protein [Lysobacter]BCT93809.1 hypothetical protein LYSCAS_28330 [Lysobacter caseinilyticus]BCT96965.1 hypothetical protein LYSHEL_28360 [Lysobacter helvus]